MDFFRLIKPDWAKKLVKKKPNPNFVREIPGPDVIGDESFSSEELQELNSLGYNVYYFPNHPSGPVNKKHLDGKDVDVFDWVYVDMDLKDKIYESKDHFLETVAKFPLPPTKIVDSGNGIHVYWRVSDLDRETHVLIQFCLIQHFKTDESIWTVLQLMRYPGTKNTKDPQNFKEAKELAEFTTDAVYQVSELLANLPSITEENGRKMAEHIYKLDGLMDVKVSIDFNPDELPSRFLKDLKVNKKLQEFFSEESKDRSSQDMSLANVLFNLDYDRKDALQILMNTKKALSHSNRQQYAFGTVDKVYRDRPKYAIESAHERKLKGAVIQNLGVEVHGPNYWDCLHNKWRTKQVLGLVAGSGVGKTTATLEMFKSMLEASPDHDSIFAFFSLEMTEGEILERWELLVGDNPDYLKKLYVISNEDDSGNQRNIGLQEIYWHIRDIEKSTGKKFLAVAIDHVDAISRHINLTKKPSFNAQGSEREANYGDVITIAKGTVCAKMKELSKTLDIFVIIQSQTTKAKDAGGDMPLGKNAAYGVSNFEWYCDYVMTLWRPLKRVQDRTALRISGWQYAKIRKAHKEDKVNEGIPYMLKFDQDVGSFSELTEQELQLANELASAAALLRKQEDKKESVVYHNSPKAKTLSLVLKHYKERKEA